MKKHPSLIASHGSQRNKNMSVTGFAFPHVGSSYYLLVDIEYSLRDTLGRQGGVTITTLTIVRFQSILRLTEEDKNSLQLFFWHQLSRCKKRTSESIPRRYEMHHGVKQETKRTNKLKHSTDPQPQSRVLGLILWSSFSNSHSLVVMLRSLLSLSTKTTTRRVGARHCRRFVPVLPGSVSCSFSLS